MQGIESSGDGLAVDRRDSGVQWILVGTTPFGLKAERARLCRRDATRALGETRVRSISVVSCVKIATGCTAIRSRVVSV